MKKVTERANDLTYTGAMGFKGEMNNAGSYKINQRDGSFGF